MDVAPYRLSGVVYGTLLNHRAALDALGDTVELPPYKGRPKAPILYVKPRNTLAADGDTVVVPSEVSELELGATLGIVIGRPACHLSAANARDFIAGYVLMNDLSIPHLPYYRPSVRFKARDGFCPIGPRVVASAEVGNPDELTLRVHVDGKLKQEWHTRDLIRPVGVLLAEVTDFMTLAPGDILAVGVAAPAPRVRAGQSTSIEAVGFGRLRNTFIGEAS
jgi:5-oxopent-3-ene-1,2,5-tricarboxylate decarboxylase/2-hydroxyhepta-2,4-diene-1,7-dioate isomerase